MQSDAPTLVADPPSPLPGALVDAMPDPSVALQQHRHPRLAGRPPAYGTVGCPSGCPCLARSSPRAP
eukprot:6358783-Prorocentrum_lima.AAC.1